AEDLVRAAASHLHQRLAALPQARPEDGVAQVRARFLDRMDAEVLGIRARAERGELRKDEPHPVCALVSTLELAQDFGEDGVLRVDEALQPESVVDHASMMPPFDTLRAAGLQACRGASTMRHP